MLNAGLLERLGLDAEASASIDAGGGNLRGKAHVRTTVLMRTCERKGEHARGDAATTPVAFDGDATDFGGVSVDEQPQSADDALATWLERDDVLCVLVAPVDLFSTGHALLADEDLFANVQGAA